MKVDMAQHISIRVPWHDEGWKGTVCKESSAYVSSAYDVCVKQKDTYQIDKLLDGVNPVSLVDDGKTYMILRKNGDLLGRLGKTFVDLIDALKKSEEISGSPAAINGISLQVQSGKAEFLGMGHLKFIEY